MGKRVEDFVSVYIDSAFSVASKERTISEFYSLLKQSAGDQFGLSPEEFQRILKPFHWTFFLENGNLPFKSPFKYTHAAYNYMHTEKDDARVSVERYSEADRNKLKEYMIKNYSVLLEHTLNNQYRQS